MKIYIAGKITGDPNYQIKFMKARAGLMKQGHIVLTPAVLPEGMTPADYFNTQVYGGGITMDVMEKLVELIGSTEYGNGSLVGKNFQKGFIEKIASNLIANGVTVQEWISVDDRLPENDVMVTGYTPCDGFVFVGYYHEEPKYDWKVWRIVTAMRSTKVMTKKVTHWMPLPQPPKGEQLND